ncbi:unnamed protein product [Arabidopsis lyrata]|nr:unnamed protein product [Arabidopsis lyrata]
MCVYSLALSDEAMVLFDSLSLCCLGLSFIILSPRLQGMATVCVHFEFSVATILSFSEKHFSVGIFCSLKEALLGVSHMSLAFRLCFRGASKTIGFWCSVQGKLMDLDKESLSLFKGRECEQGFGVPRRWQLGLGPLVKGF